MWQPMLPGMSRAKDIPPGRLGDIWHALPPDERMPYLDALADRNVPAETLSAALARLGQTASPSLIRTHRRTMARQEAP